MIQRRLWWYSRFGGGMGEFEGMWKVLGVVLGVMGVWDDMGIWGSFGVIWGDMGDFGGMWGYWVDMAGGFGGIWEVFREICWDRG